MGCIGTCLLSPPATGGVSMVGVGVGSAAGTTCFVVFFSLLFFSIVSMSHNEYYVNLNLTNYIFQ